MRKPSCGAALAVVFVLLSGMHVDTPLSAQQGPPALVIEGGTLIDGNGGAPVVDSSIVIQGNTITGVGRRGQVAHPANARVIRADGKFVLPGLFDSQLSYAWYFGEALLNHGITSTIDVGTSGETAVPYRDAAIHGHILAPRAFTSVSRLVAEPEGRVTGLEHRMTPSRVPTSPADARAYVKEWIDAGADYVILDDGGLTPEYSKEVFDEARRAGKPVFTRAYGPEMLPRDAALLGAANLPHSAGIGFAVAKDPSKWGAARRDDRNELDRFAEMDETKARELIDVLVKHKVALVPTFMINFPGYPKDWPRFEAEARRLFTDPNLLAYYPATAVQAAFNRFTRIDRGEVRERRMKGYQNAMRFHKMFVDAGGRLVVSGNTNSTKAPGLDMHHEMQVMAEAGLTPMQIIQGSTQWAAEMLGKQRTLGSVEAGKLADVIILNQDPLKDIRNIGSIDTVIFNGKVLERGYRRGYSSPFSNIASLTAPVEGLEWAVALKKANRIGLQAEDAGGNAGSSVGINGVPNPIESPQPAIEAVAPYIVTQGSGPVTVRLKGFNFVRKSAVTFKGAVVPSRVVSATEVEVTLAAAVLQTAGRFPLAVRNAGPLDPFFTQGMWGSGTSNQAHLIVSFRN